MYSFTSMVMAFPFHEAPSSSEVIPLQTLTLPLKNSFFICQHAVLISIHFPLPQMLYTTYHNPQPYLKTFLMNIHEKMIPTFYLDI